MTDLVKQAQEAGVPLEEIVTELAGRIGADPAKLLSGSVAYEELIPALHARLSAGKAEEAEIQRDFGALERIAFKAKEANSLTENVAILLQSRLPTGKPVWEDGGIQWKSAEEVWGKHFMDSTPEGRRRRILEIKDRKLEDSNPDLFASDRRGEQGDFGGAAGLTGTFLGTLADPSTLVAAPASLVRMAVADALLGATWSVADQAAQTGEVSAKQTAIDTVIAGAAGPLLIQAGRGLGTAGRQVVKKISSGSEMRSLDRMAVQLEDTIYEGISSGMELQPAIARARQKLDMDEDLYNRVQMKSTVKSRIPESMEEAQEVLKYRAGKELDSGSREGLLSKVGKTADDVIGTLDTQVGNISRRVHQAVNNYDLGLAQTVQGYNARIEPFISVFNKIGNKGVRGVGRQLMGARNPIQRTLTRALANGDFAAARSIIRREAGDEGVEAFEEINSVLADLHKRGTDSGMFTSKVENYWPRFVEDFGLFSKITGTTQKSRVIRELDKAAKERGLTNHRALPQAVKQDIVNQVYRGRRPHTAEGASPNSKARQVEDVTDDMLDAYTDPIAALNTYVRASAAKIAKRELFGLDKSAKSAARSADRSLKEATKKTDYMPESLLEETDEDLAENIGRYVLDAIEEEGLDAVQADQLELLLKARFIEGEQGVGSITAGYRNLIHTTLLGNPLSAMVQLGDIGVSAYRNGFGPTLRALANRTGNKISVEDLGLDNVIAEAVDSFVGTAKLLNGALHYSGFKFADRLGKNTFIRSALLRGQREASNPKGLEKLRKAHAANFGDEFAELVADLRGGEVTDRVKLMLWNELTSYQPVSLSQMPVRYLKIPSGRILYALKTFGIKQLDLLRTDIVQNFRSGNKAQAAKNLAAYMAIVPTMNMGVQEARNMLLQREPLEVDDLPDAFGEALLRTFFMNEYMINRYGENGEVASMFVSTVTPPIQLWDDIGKTIFGGTGAILSGDLDEIPPDILKHTPIFGGLINNFLLGGREKFDDRRNAK
tara:strand:- start:11237 stop:14248 length:3012 start_codon:yes stop_codon:yes gene_type:complete